MKQMVVFLLMVVSTIGAMSQEHRLYPMVQPLKEGGYTVSEFEHFVLAPTSLSVDYSDKLLSRINRFLRETGLDKNYNQGMPLDRRHISFIFQKVEKKYRIYPNGFTNSHQSKEGNKIVAYFDDRRFEGMVFTLCIDGYELDLAKSECDNLVDVPYLFISPPLEKKIIEEKEITSNVLPQDYGEVKIQKKITLADVGVKTTTKVKAKGFWGWLVAGLIASAATTAYLLAHSHHHHVDTGGPGGAPITPAVIPDPVIPSTGGPGGAPTTK